MIIDHPRELDLPRLLLSPGFDADSRERLVVTKLGIQAAAAYGFRYLPGSAAEGTGETIEFDVRLSDFLRPIIGQLFSFYGKFWHSRVLIRSRYDEHGKFGVSALVVPYASPQEQEVLNARVERRSDGAYTFTLTDLRWRGQSITLDPRRGTITITGVLYPGHKLSGRYALKRHRFA